MTNAEFKAMMKQLNSLKKKAFSLADKGGGIAEYCALWEQYLEHETRFEMGQKAEVVYMYLLGMLSYVTNHFRVSCSMREDTEESIDFRVNGYPVQVKTNWLVLDPDDITYCQEHGIRLESCLYSDDGVEVLNKLAVPHAIPAKKLNQMARERAPVIRNIDLIWGFFASYANKKKEADKK